MDVGGADPVGRRRINCIEGIHRREARFAQALPDHGLVARRQLRTEHLLQVVLVRPSARPVPDGRGLQGPGLITSSGRRRRDRNHCRRDLMARAFAPPSISCSDWVSNCRRRRTTWPKSHRRRHTGGSAWATSCTPARRNSSPRGSRAEMGVPSSPVRTLPVQTIVPGVVVRGPFGEFAAQVRALHRRFHGRA